MRKSKKTNKKREALLNSVKWQEEAVANFVDADGEVSEAELSVLNLWFLYHGSKGLTETPEGTGGNVVRITVKTIDGTHYDKDFPTNTLQDSQNIFGICCKYLKELKELEPIDNDFLLSEGFVWG